MAEKKPRLNWRRLVLLVLAAVCLISGFLMVRDLLRSRHERAANDQLAQQVRDIREMMKQQAAAEKSPAPAPPDSSQEPPEEEPEEGPEAEALPKYAESGILFQYDALWQQNHDLAGWLWIEGTQIDYPVMYTPDSPEYYLRRAFDKSYALSGTLFIGEGCAPDASHVIIYGHNMKNGTMFGSLPDYASADYAREHPVIHFDTMAEEYDYQVVAAFYGKIYNVDDTGVFRYYQYTDLSRQEVFEDYIRQVRAAAVYDSGVDVEYGDYLLTLSTCSYHTSNGRFVVLAVRQDASEPD